MTAAYPRRTARVVLVGDSLGTVTIEGLRVAFDVNKFAGAGSNHGTIRVWNLAADRRKAVARAHPAQQPVADPATSLFLSAGHMEGEGERPASQPLPLVFGGTVTRVVNAKVGPDWITEIEALAGLEQTARATVTLSDPGPTPPQALVEALLAPLRLRVTFSDAARTLLIAQAPVRDFAASGHAIREAAVLLRRYGLRLTADDHGSVLVYQPGEARGRNGNARTATEVYGPGSGLVGWPAVTRTGIRCRVLLRPQLQLLAQFYVQSRTLQRQGTEGLVTGSDAAPFVATHIAHRGDTGGADWFTDIEGIHPGLTPGVLTEPGAPVSANVSGAI